MMKARLFTCSLVSLAILLSAKAMAGEIVKPEGVQILRDIRKQSEETIRRHCDNDTLTLAQCRTKLVREAAKTRKYCEEEGQPEEECYRRVQALWGTKVEPL